MKKQKERMEG